MSFIRNADRVELVFEEYPNPVKMVLTDPEAIRRLVSVIELVPKDPCLCGHTQWVVFWRGDKKLEAMICEHCFDVVTGRGKGRKRGR